ncbi:CRISPR-associated endoribonuclease Cas6 [Tunicatimonas pelagia]|uniref:CRISPR-associated endoribonuclease Cas6 n=1 Tax=Tunicatimonas pelagia TaxID=931531 RepID=UPI0026663948|nr:CRISPR-associated endoribonuclease Cas6 [Tunicatimonas pelagia]WKN44380.1 CRISPR-associated endoribonuclease Cas6 [Tunicatimonas pelagia]
MRFNLVLRVIGNHRVLPINYQYPLHSWVYRVIQQADAEFSRFLHDKGYTVGSRRFKLFTFSQLKGEPYRIFAKEERIGFYGPELQLGVSFWLPEAAEHFIRGLFMGQQFRLGDRISQVDLEVVRIEALPRPQFTETMRYRILTPVVVSIRLPEHKHPQYQIPNNNGYTEQLLKNLQHKAEAARLNLPEVADNNRDFTEAWKLKLNSSFRKKGKVS